MYCSYVKLIKLLSSLVDVLSSSLHLGRLAQLARAPALQAGGQRFESSNAHIEMEKKGV